MTITIQPIDASAGAPAYTAQQERQALASLIGAGSLRALGANSGFRVGTPAATVTVTSTTWTVGPCAAIIDPAFTSTQAPYRWATDTALTGSVNAADGTNPRKDILYIQVNDASVGDGSGLRTAPVLYLAGNPATSPSAPALPARSFLVATLDVPKVGAGSPTATLNPVFQVAAGGILPVATQAARDALSAYAGMTIWRTDLSVMQTYNGSAWLGEDFTQVNTGDAAWTYRGGLYRDSRFGGVPKVCFTLLLTRAGGTVNLTTTPIQAFAGLIPAGWRPIGHSVTANTVIQTSAGADKWGAMVRVNAAGDLFIRTDTGSASIAVNEMLPIHLEWVQ